jgi:4-hydroxybenzoate polyprenyltransferase
MRRTAAVFSLARACHPEPTVAVTAMVTAFAASAGRGWGTVWVAAAVLAGQLSVGWSNDFLDADRDASVVRADKPIPAGLIGRRVVGTAALTALVASIPLSLASGWLAALPHLAGIAAAWSYNLGVKGTVFSPVPYAIGFGGLPAFVVLGLPGQPIPPVWLVCAGALLGLGAHFANVLPDLADDIRLGVRGLPHRLGARISAALAATLLLAASLVLAFGPGRPSPAVLGAVGAGVVALLTGGLLAARQPGSRAAFRVAMLVAVVDAALLIARGASLS